MSKILNILFIGLVIAIIPFAYFFMRDFVYAGSEEADLNACTPFNMEVIPERFQATVKWRTNEECVGYIKYDVTPKSENGKTASSTDGILPVQNHTVIIDELKPHNDYYIWIYSNEIPYGEGRAPIQITL